MLSFGTSSTKKTGARDYRTRVGARRDGGTAPGSSKSFDPETTRDLRVGLSRVGLGRIAQELSELVQQNYDLRVMGSLRCVVP